MRQWLAIIKKEFRQIRRDPLSLGMLILVPVLLLVLYGYALSFDVRLIRLAVLDEDNSFESRQFLESVFASSYFVPAGTLAREQESEPWLIKGRARAILRIPRGFSGQIERGEDARIQVIMDGADANTATIANGYLEALCERSAGRLHIQSATLPMVNLQPRIWFNPDLQSSHFLVPALIGLLLMLSAVIATSLSIVREKERETMEQIMVSPVTPWELLFGKIIPYVVIGFITMALVLLLGRILFGVAIVGSYALLALTTLVFLFAALGMGLLISSITTSQLVAFQIAILTTLLPSLILSGFIFPIKNMPVFIQGITLLVIPRYFVTALRGIILKGATFMDLWPQLAALLFLGILFNAVAIRKIRKTL